MYVTATKLLLFLYQHTPQLCVVYLLIVTEQKSLYLPLALTTCHSHYNSRQRAERGGIEHTLKAAADHSGETFTVHRRVGMASQPCQTDGVLELGQEERCSIHCLA